MEAQKRVRKFKFGYIFPKFFHSSGVEEQVSPFWKLDNQGYNIMSKPRKSKFLTLDTSSYRLNSKALPSYDVMNLGPTRAFSAICIEIS